MCLKENPPFKAGVLHTKLSTVNISLEKDLVDGQWLGTACFFTFIQGDDRRWDGWMASLTRWTWVWVNSGSWWLTGRPGVLVVMGSQRVGHDWATELNWTEPNLPEKRLLLCSLSEGYILLQRLWMKGERLKQWCGGWENEHMWDSGSVFVFFFFSWVCRISSLTRHWTRASCYGSMES